MHAPQDLRNREERARVEVAANLRVNVSVSAGERGRLARGAKKDSPGAACARQAGDEDLWGKAHERSARSPHSPRAAQTASLDMKQVRRREHNWPGDNHVPGGLS